MCDLELSGESKRERELIAEVEISGEFVAKVVSPKCRRERKRADEGEKNKGEDDAVRSCFGDGVEDAMLQDPEHGSKKEGDSEADPGVIFV